MMAAFLALGALVVFAAVKPRAAHRALIIAWVFATALCVCSAVAFDRTVDGLLRRATAHASPRYLVGAVARSEPRRHQSVR
jgi:hypothetical protein